jgi:hypothetical protein
MCLENPLGMKVRVKKKRGKKKSSRPKNLSSWLEMTRV